MVVHKSIAADRCVVGYVCCAAAGAGASYEPFGEPCRGGTSADTVRILQHSGEQSLEGCSTAWEQ